MSDGLKTASEMRRNKAWGARLSELDTLNLSDEAIATRLTAEGFKTATGRLIDGRAVAQHRWYRNRGRHIMHGVATVASIVAECRANGTVAAFRKAFAASTCHGGLS